MTWRMAAARRIASRPAPRCSPAASCSSSGAQTGVALNNDADTVRLLGPDGAEVDAFAYTKPRSDASYSRSTDGDGTWTDTYPPSPGRSNVPATPTPTATATATATPFPAGVTLNEILPDPQTVDWDSNGTADWSDEWIELYNTGSTAAALGGWTVADDTKTYTIPVGTVIWPPGHLLLFRRQTGLSLSDWRDRVTLLAPGRPARRRNSPTTAAPARIAATAAASTAPAPGRAECYVTPGQANRLLPTPQPSGGDGGSGGGTAASRGSAASPISIAAARAAPADTRVTVTGTVTFPPGILEHTLYIQDATGGVKVYLRSGDYPPLAVGDTLRVTGWTRPFHGETEISVPAPSYLTLLGPGSPPAPAYLRTGQMGEAHEGRLVLIMGGVVKFEPQAITLDDGSGPARVYFPPSCPGAGHT